MTTPAEDFKQLLTKEERFAPNLDTLQRLAVKDYQALYEKASNLDAFWDEIALNTLRKNHASRPQSA